MPRKSLPVVDNLSGKQAVADEELLTAEELAPKIKVQTGTVYQLVRRGDIPYDRINHKILRFRLSEVQKALAEHYHVPAKPLTRRPFPKRKKEIAK
jgi:excisionase family DNA binding protein